MAIKQGGGPNPPVMLDPVQQIVNVHWPAKFTHIAFSVRINAESPIGNSSGVISCGSGGLVTVGAPHWPFYVSRAHYSTTHEDPIGLIRGRDKNGNWHELDGSETVEGLPDLPHIVDFAPWQVVSPADPDSVINPLAVWNEGALAFGEDTNSNGRHNSYAVELSSPVVRHKVQPKWIIDEGDPMGITLPFSSAEFNTGTNDKFATHAEILFDGGAECVAYNAGDHMYAPVVAGDELFAELPVGPGVTVTYQGDTYTAMGTRVIDATDTIWILCELTQEGTS